MPNRRIEPELSLREAQPHRRSRRWSVGIRAFLALLVGLSTVSACTASSRPAPAEGTTSSASVDDGSGSPGIGSAPTATGEATADPGAFASKLDFVDITDQVNQALAGVTSRKLSFARAVMTVPLDWNNPGNEKTVAITVLRVRAASQHDRIGSLVINPGGPGGSGVEAALNLAVSELPQAILDRFDIVGFDPRGVGLSDPIHCIPNKEKDAQLNMPPDPTSDAQWNATVAEAKKVADECYAIYGNDLTFFSTAQTVRDMEALRAKLGDPKLTYLGYSYGTLLGAEYASAYPGKIRALVLDGAVDPTIDSVQQDKTQAAGFQLAFQHYAAHCVQHSCDLGPNPQNFIQDLMAKADAHPIPSGNKSDPRVAQAGAILLAVISALYDESQWDQLTTALVAASHGESSGILELDDQYNQRQPGGTYTNIQDANVTIGCADETQRPSVEQARALQATWRADNPLFGGSAAASLFLCSLWKAPPDTPIKVTDAGAPPVLVIGTTGDPATPISGAKHLASLLGTADLLTWQGDGHTAYPKTSCVTKDVNAYLITLKVPQPGATCPAG
jgi:pimeloyl-ACP methyl ester carboxylesterase